MVPPQIARILRGIYHNEDGNGKAIKEKIWMILISDESESQTKGNLTIAVQNLTKEDLVDTSLSFIFRSLLKPHIGEILSSSSSGMENFLPNLIRFGILQFQKQKAVDVLEEFLRLNSTTRGLDPPTFSEISRVALNQSNHPTTIRLGLVRCILRSLEKSSINEPNYFQQFSMDQLNYIFQKICGVITLKRDNPFEPRVKILVMALLCKLLENEDVALKQCLIAQIFSNDQMSYLMDQLCLHRAVMFEDGSVVNDYDPGANNNDPEPGNHESQTHETRNTKNHNHVSTFAAKLIHSVLIKNGSRACNEIIISALSQALLQSDSKLTKIICSEALFFASVKAKVVFSAPVLNLIQPLTYSPISDVRIYITCAYCNSLANQSGDGLEPQHVNSLVDLYALKRVILAKTDYTEFVNPLILQVFLDACRVGIGISEQCFGLLALVLNRTNIETSTSSDYQTVETVIQLITWYCRVWDHAADLPQIVLVSVENLFLKSHYFIEPCAAILEKCLSMGHHISVEVINKFATYLTTEEPCVSLPFLKRLALANEHQEIPDGAFALFEMEILAVRLSPPGLIDGGKRQILQFEQKIYKQPEILSCLIEMARNGKTLSKLGQAVIHHHLREWPEENKNLILCLSMVASNGQSLPEEIIQSALQIPYGDTTTANLFSKLDFAKDIVKMSSTLLLPAQLQSYLYNTLTWGNRPVYDVKTLRKVIDVVRTMIQYNKLLPVDVAAAYCEQLRKLKSSSTTTMTPENLKSLIMLVRSGAFERRENGNKRMALEACREMFRDAALSQDATLVEVGREGVTLLDGDVVIPDVGSAKLWETLQVTVELSRAGGGDDDNALRFSIEEMKAILPHDITLLRQVGQLLAERGDDGEAMTSVEEKIFEVICDLFKTARENPNHNDFAQEADKVLKNMLEAWRGNLDQRMVTLAVSAGCRGAGPRNDDEVSRMECGLKGFKENPIDEVSRSSLETLFGNEDLVKPTIKKIVETMSSLDVDVSHWKSLKNVVHPVAAWILSGNLEMDVTNKNQWGSEIETFVEILEDEILHGQSCPIPVTILRAYERILRVVPPNARGSNSKNGDACVTTLASILDFEGPYCDMVKFLICRIFETFIQNHDQIPETLLKVTLDGARQSADNLLRAASVSNLLLIREKCERLGQSQGQAPRITTHNTHKSEYDSDADSNSDDDEVGPDRIRPFQRVAQRIVTNSLEQRLSPEAVTREMKLVKLLFSLNHIDKSVIKEKPKDEWPLQLMISDTISTLAKTDDQKMILFPVAKELCNILVETPLLRLCVVQGVKNFVADNPGEMEIARILDFVNMSLRVQNPPPAEPWNPEWLKNLICDGLTSKLLEKMGEEFQPQEMIERAMTLPNPLPLGFLDEIISSIKNPSVPSNREKQERMRNRAQMRKLLEVVKGKQEQVELFRGRLESQREDGLTLAEMLLRFQTAQQTSLFRSEMETSTVVAAQVTRIEELTECLIAKNYSIQHIQKLFAKAKQSGESSTNISEVLEALENVLYQIIAYEGTNLGPNNFPYIVGQLVETNVTNWVSRCNEMVLALVISVDRGEKSAQTIAEEFRDLNGANQYAAGFLQTITKTVSRIQEGEAVTTFQNLDITTNSIKRWTLQDISKWAKEIRARNIGDLTQKVIQEAVTVISRACRLQWNYSLSPIQILALFAYFKDRRGKLLQVVTGSGKSTIIASIAVMRCLLGRKVDIYTSSPVLAERDSRVWQPFYHMFGLTCAHNGDSSGTGYVEGSKSCYNKDIVYGDTAQFQFDTLRDEFNCLQTRAKRPYEIAIVDEVDYMFVDDSSKLARLASTLPGMDMLGTLYHLIWHRLHDVKERLYGVGDSGYYLEGERKWDEINGNVVYRFADPSGSIKAIRDLPGYIRSHENDEEVLEQSLIFKVDDVDKFVMDHLQKYTRALIGDESFSENRKPVQILPLPKHIVQFARFQVGHWVKSAITALHFTPGIHYIIDQDQVKPVEYKSSGVIQNQTRWCNGLHQFLQLKHGLRLTVETVTTNFMSNISMFRKYNGNIVGFTGTLGTEFGRQVLQDVYNVDSLVIPELHRKRYYQLRDTVTPNVINWRDSIIRSALHEASNSSNSKKRAVLVICETIKDAEMIARCLQMTETFGINVKCYTRNDQNQEGQVEQVRPGDIIVATNLAGRGTDIKAAMVEQFGGIHVILTYLPTSLRVELQAFGRTSRQGNSGTGQLILHMDCGTSGSAEELKSQRNTREDEGLSRFQTEQFPIIETKDRLFQEFTSLYSTIRKDLTSNSWTKYKMQAITGIERAILLALEEQWAIFLKKVDDKIIDLERSDEVYQELENDILAAYYSEENSSDVMTPTDNCFYWINQGNEYYVRWNTLKDYTGKALECFQKAVEMDPEFCAGAHAGLAFALLRGKTRWFRSYLHGQDYKEKALEHLRKAMKILSLEKGTQESLETLVLNRQGDTNSELFKQITERVNLIGDYCQNLEEAMRCVERTFRRIYSKETVTGVGKFSYELDYKDPLTSFYKRNNVPTTTRYQLTFNDLTVRSDMGTQDQAEETIGNERTVSLQVSNQDLEQLAKDVEQHTEGMFSTMEFHDIESFEKLKRLKDSIGTEHWSLKVFGKTRDFVREALEIFIKDCGPGKNIFVSWQDAISTMSRCRKVTKMTDLPYQTEDLLFDVDLEVTTGDFDLSRLNNLLSDTSNYGFLRYNLGTNWAKKFWGTGDDPGILQEYHRRNQVTLSRLPKDKALMVIKILRAKKIAFRLVFDDLSYSKAEDILRKCSRKQEDIEEIKHIKKLGHQFLSSSYVPLDVIHELTSRGLELMPGFSEKQFVPWRTMATLGGIAAVQMAAGTVLVVTGVGSPWGVALITEGVADLVIAQQTYVHRDFNWKHYGVRKAISLTISAVTVGISTLSKGGQGIKEMIEGAVSEVTEQGATSFFFKGGEEVVKLATGKNMEVALKCLGLQGLEAVKTVGLMTYNDVMAEFNFEDARENIRKQVELGVRAGLGDAENVRKMGQCFAVGKSDRILLDKADGWLGEVTNPQSSFWSEAWHRVVVPLCIGMFSNEKLLGSNFKLLGVILGGDGNSVNIQQVTKEVCQHIASKLDAEASIHTPSYAIQSHFCVPQRQAVEIVEMMTMDGFRVLKYPEESDLPSSGNVELLQLRSLFHKINQQIEEFSINTESASRLMMIIINGITDQIISESNRHLASPTATYAMGKILNRNTETLLKNFLVDDSQLSVVQRRIRELRGRDPTSLTLEEMNFLRTHDNPNQGPRGISNIPSYSGNPELLQLNAIALGATLQNILSEGPADTAVILLLMRLNRVKNVRLILDDPDFNYATEIGRDIKIVTRISLSEYSVKDTGSGAVETVTGVDGVEGEDAGYKMLSLITGGRTQRDLRNQAVTYILQNPENFARIYSESARWLGGMSGIRIREVYEILTTSGNYHKSGDKINLGSLFKGSGDDGERDLGLMGNMLKVDANLFVNREELRVSISASGLTIQLTSDLESGDSGNAEAAPSESNSLTSFSRSQPGNPASSKDTSANSECCIV